MDKTIVLPDKCVPKETVLLCDHLPVHIHQAMAPYEVRKVRKQEMVGKELNRGMTFFQQRPTGGREE